MKNFFRRLPAGAIPPPARQKLQLIHWGSRESSAFDLRLESEPIIKGCIEKLQELLTAVPLQGGEFFRFPASQSLGLALTLEFPDPAGAVEASASGAQLPATLPEMGGNRCLDGLPDGPGFAKKVGLPGEDVDAAGDVLHEVIESRHRLLGINWNDSPLVQRMEGDFLCDRASQLLNKRTILPDLLLIGGLANRKVQLLPSLRIFRNPLESAAERVGNVPLTLDAQLERRGRRAFDQTGNRRVTAGPLGGCKKVSDGFRPEGRGDQQALDVELRLPGVFDQACHEIPVQTQLLSIAHQADHYFPGFLRREHQRNVNQPIDRDIQSRVDVRASCGILHNALVRVQFVDELQVLPAARLVAEVVHPKEPITAPAFGHVAQPELCAASLPSLRKPFLVFDGREVDSLLPAIAASGLK